MAMSEHVRRLRSFVGNELLLLPSVSVLPWDDGGRVLLVQSADDGLWMTIGGAVEIDEHPADAATREAAEEAGVIVELTGIRAVVGGERYRVFYPNGDVTAYVATVYDATVVGGTPLHDGEETTAAEWFHPSELGELPLNRFTRALVDETVLVPDQTGKR